MRISLLASAAALALMTGTAMAQSSVTVITPGAPQVVVPAPAPPPTMIVVPATVPNPNVSSKTTVTTSQDPMTGSMSQTKDQTSMDAYGRQVQKTESYNASPGHEDSSAATTVKDPSGAVSTTQHEEWSNGASMTRSNTTSTTTSTVDQ